MKTRPGKESTNVSEAYRDPKTAGERLDEKALPLWRSGGIGTVFLKKYVWISEAST
jgi:hypothetical protein